MKIFRILALIAPLLLMNACGGLDGKPITSLGRTQAANHSVSFSASGPSTPLVASAANHTREVVIAASGLPDWQAAVKNVDSVAISKSDQVTDLQPLTELGRLQTLDVGFNEFSTEQLLVLTRIKSLRVVIIEGNRVTQAIIDAFASLPAMHLIFHGGSFVCPDRAGLKCVGATVRTGPG